MTPWQKRATALTRRMADDMKLRNMSQKTIDAYTYHVGRFAEFLGYSPEQATPEDVRSFQLHLIEVRKVGWSSFNQAPGRGLELFAGYVFCFEPRIPATGRSAWCLLVESRRRCRRCSAVKK